MKKATSRWARGLALGLLPSAPASADDQAAALDEMAGTAPENG